MFKTGNWRSSWYGVIRAENEMERKPTLLLHWWFHKCYHGPAKQVPLSTVLIIISQVGICVEIGGPLG